MRWGPDGRGGALSVTLDHLGEAAAMAFGSLPQGHRIGTHYTAFDGLRTTLELLRGHRVSWFIEGMNAQLYPDALRRIRDEGHEIGLHGWCHELWDRQSADAREQALDRSLDAMAVIGVAIDSFRPPGGGMPPGATVELAARGFRSYSPAGPAGATASDGSLSVQPYACAHVDAFNLQDSAGARDFRVRLGFPEAPCTAAAWREALHDAVRVAHEEHVHVCVVLHPHLFLPDPDLLGITREFLDDLRQQDDLWLAPCGEVAAWLDGDQARSSSLPV